MNPVTNPFAPGAGTPHQNSLVETSYVKRYVLRLNGYAAGFLYNTERQLLYVACTRARDHLLVTSVAPASEFLDDLRV
jgi:superfamily I DNA/RNA helicase